MAAARRDDNEDGIDSRYELEYISVYTKRQRAILDGNIPLEKVKTDEITSIIRKAERLGDIETYEIASVLRSKKMNPDSYYPQHTVEEAKTILQDLTPWEIDWGDHHD